MIYLTSAELDDGSRTALIKIIKYVDNIVNEALQSGQFSHLDVKITYVPIAIDPSRGRVYKSRTRVLRGENSLNIAPVLNYNTFKQSNFDECLKEYVSGITVNLCRLSKLGISVENIDLVKAFFTKISD